MTVRVPSWLTGLGQASSRGLNPAPNGDTWQQIRDNYGSDAIRNALCWQFSHKCTCAEATSFERGEAEKIYQDVLNRRLNWYAREQAAPGDLNRYPYYRTEAYVEDTMAYYNAAGCLAAKAPPLACNQWGLDPASGRECYKMRALDDDLKQRVLRHLDTVDDALREQVNRYVVWGPDGRPRRPSLQELTSTDFMEGVVKTAGALAVVGAITVLAVGAVGVGLGASIVSSGISLAQYKSGNATQDLQQASQQAKGAELQARAAAEAAAKQKAERDALLAKILAEQNGTASKTPLIVAGAVGVVLILLLASR